MRPPCTRCCAARANVRVCKCVCKCGNPAGQVTAAVSAEDAPVHQGEGTAAFQTKTLKKPPRRAAVEAEAPAAAEVAGSDHRCAATVCCCLLLPAACCCLLLPACCCLSVAVCLLRPVASYCLFCCLLSVAACYCLLLSVAAVAALAPLHVRFSCAALQPGPPCTRVRSNVAEPVEDVGSGRFAPALPSPPDEGDPFAELENMFSPPAPAPAVTAETAAAPAGGGAAESEPVEFAETEAQKQGRLLEEMIAIARQERCGAPLNAIIGSSTDHVAIIDYHQWQWPQSSCIAAGAVSSKRHRPSACRGTWAPLVPCPLCHNLPSLSPQSL